MTDFLLWVVLVGLFIAHWAVSGSRLHQLGVVLPALWTLAIIALAVTGHMHGVRDWAVAVIGLLVLTIIWDRRRHESGQVASTSTTTTSARERSMR